MRYYSKPIGWRNESYRHSLASRGIKTKKLSGPIVSVTRHGIPITIKNIGSPGRAYPVNQKDIKESMDSIPNNYVKGIKEINLRDPSPVAGSKQDKAYAQWVRTKEDGLTSRGNRINIFSQPYNRGSFVGVEPGNENPVCLKNYVKKYVIPHEVGHHVAASKNNNLPILVEEAKADAFANKENPDNPKILEKYINRRVLMFGEQGTI
jgi:hypothetical protein